MSMGLVVPDAERASPPSSDRQVAPYPVMGDPPSSPTPLNETLMVVPAMVAAADQGGDGRVAGTVKGAVGADAGDEPTALRTRAVHV